MAEDMMQAVLEEERRAKKRLQAAENQAAQLKKQAQKESEQNIVREQAEIAEKLQGLQQQTEQAKRQTLADQQSHTKKAVHTVQQEMEKRETEAVRIVVSALLSEPFVGGK